MTIKNSSGGTVGTPVDLTTTPSGSIPLAPGVYTVVFNLEGEEAVSPGVTKPVKVIWNELLYVYATLTSSWSKTFTNDDFYRTHWNVTLDYDTNSEYDPASGITYTSPNMTIATAIQSVEHGYSLDSYGAIIDPPATPGGPGVEKPGYRFDGWFTTQACAAPDKWDVSDPVHKDMYLWAGWTPNTLGLTLTVENITQDPTEFASLLTPITISRGNGTPLSQSITLSGTDDLIEWRVEGVGIYPDYTNNTNSITLNGATDNYNTLGGHVLELTVTIGTGTDAKEFR
jgi:uncharacterized repeat protein (TIGR02543 family)